MKRFQLSAIVVLALAAAAVSLGQTQDKKRIEAPTIAAYRKLGAYYGGWTEDYRGVRVGEKYAEEGLAGFRFDLANGPLAKLPDVAVPFCLDFSKHKATDADLKQLAHLENLTKLELSESEVTSAGLKHLTGLKNLKELYLFRSRVTDEGMKELAVLETLTSLDLSGTAVSNAGLRELAPLKNLAGI